MAQISIIYRSRDRACGISQFCKHLMIELRSRNLVVEGRNLQIGEPSEFHPCVLVQYVPSMWTGHASAFDQMLADASRGQVVVVMLGLYGPGDLRHRRETPCSDLPQHLASIAKYADSVVALSESCRQTYELWFQHGVQPKHLTSLLHPGIYGSVACRATEGYVFFGGIIRPKKGVDADVRSLLDAYNASGEKVWLHAANGNVGNDSELVWRTSTGLCSDDEWVQMLSGAAVVICPYDTRIQCVSGVIAEALSVGTPVLATNFPFAREMQHLYPDHVSVENDLREWPKLSRQFTWKRLSVPGYPNWRMFTERLLQELDLD